MRKFGSSKRACWWFVAALGALMGLGFSSAPAGADVCGDFDDIGSGLYGIWGDTYESFFPIGDEGICGPLTGKFQAACEKMVKDAVKCWDRQIDAVTKAAKIPCKTTSSVGACEEPFQDNAESEKEAVEQEATGALADCADAADAYFAFCMFP